VSKFQVKADKEWARVIRQVGRCEMCGRRTTLNAHHIIHRTKFCYRHDLSNGICLCVSCHMYGSHSAHNDRTFFWNWLEKNRPGQWKWFLDHTVPYDKKVGNTIVHDRKPINSKHRGDEVEYNELKEM